MVSTFSVLTTYPCRDLRIITLNGGSSYDGKKPLKLFNWLVPRTPVRYTSHGIRLEGLAKVEACMDCFRLVA